MLVALGLATGTAVVQRPSSATVASGGAPAAAMQRAPGSAGAADFKATQPIVALLADSLGVDVEGDADAAARAATAWRTYLSLKIQRESLPAEGVVVAALDVVLADLLGSARPPRDEGVWNSAPELTPVQAVEIIRGYSHPELRDDVDVRKDRATLLSYLDGEHRRRPTIEMIRNAADCRSITLDIIIATLPDYVDSQTRRLFDTGLSGVQKAAFSMSYSLDRFHLPESISGGTGGHGDHEVGPGAVLFRQGNKRLLVLIVTEMATSGLHRGAFQSAVEFVAAWHAASDGRRKCEAGPGAAPVRDADLTLKILGPFFSGTTPSLHQALQSLDRQSPAGLPKTVKILSGTATDPENAELTFQGPRGMRVEFNATVRSSAEIEQALYAFIAGLNPNWRNGERIALLVEANTKFGQGVRERRREAVEITTKDFKPLTAQYPLHISRLRGSAGSPGSAFPLFSTPAMRLSLDERTSPKDLVPSFTPDLTAPVVESALRNLLSSLRRERYAAVGIFATDARDHLFLAREVARAVPNVLMFGTETDLLYINPEYAPFLKGTIIASSYPLFNETQLIATPARGREVRHQFTVNGEQGLYNAAVLLIADGGNDPLQKKHLVDYGPPDVDCAKHDCVPPVWLTVVGSNALWPVDYYRPTPAQGRPYTIPVRFDEVAVAQTQAARLLSWWALALFVLLCGIAVLHVVGVYLAGYGERRHAMVHAPRTRPVPAPPQSRSIRERSASLVEGTKHTAHELDHLAKAAFHWQRSHLMWLFYLPSHVDGATHRRSDRSVKGDWADQQHRAYLIVALLTVALGMSVAGVLAWIWALDSPRRGSVQPLVVATIAIVAIVGIVVTILLYARHLVIHRRSLKWRRHVRLTCLVSDTATWAVVATTGVAAFGVHYLFVLADMGPGQLTLTYLRLTTFSSGVSFVIPLTLLLGTIYVWAAWNLRRLKMQTYQQHQSFVFSELLTGRDRGTKSPLGANRFRERLRWTLLELAPWIRLRARGELVSRWCLLPLLAGSGLLLIGHGMFTAIDGPEASRLLSWCSLWALVLATDALARSADQGFVLLESLSRMGSHPIGGAFSRVATKPLDWRLRLTPLRRLSLAPLVAEIQMLRPYLDPVSGKAERAFAELDRLGAVGNGDVATPILATEHWPAITEVIEVLYRWLCVAHWTASARAAGVASGAGSVSNGQRAEDVVAYTMAFVLRNLLARVIAGLTASLIAFALIGLAHLLYPFQGRHFWLSADLTCFVIAAALTCLILIRFERDAILSTLWAGTTGRLRWTGGFFYRIAVTAAVPVILVIASLFPELAGSLVGIMEPLQKVLP